MAFAGHAQGSGQVGEFFFDIGCVQCVDFIHGVDDVVHADTSAFTEVIGLAEGFGDNENIRENDGGIQWKAFQGLKGYLSGKLGGLDHFGKRVFLLEGPVFR